MLGFIMKFLLTVVVSTWLIMQSATGSFLSLPVLFATLAFALFIWDAVISYRKSEERKENLQHLNDFLKYKQSKYRGF
ncbi:hypothetical protein ACFX5U_06340 [Sphingobacterium sp. SG20118]|uniref:hypothetical protein n=1 Tax=Sphingobacterium TaxID=28453 RepID=UPI0004F5E159|nr:MULTISPECIES: hypothetical protein [Sphingobacterium]AIM36586.1 hypothetical protein KO02_07610 [Sphingobacterium sp. ML3W]MDH5827238.1 hypothetical protein [Sphingobacterium faecium]